MKRTYRIPHVAAVELPRPHVIRVSFDDVTVRDLEFQVGESEGTVFAPLDGREFFAHVSVDPESRTVVWPNGVDLDPAVLHGDFEPAGISRFRDVSPTGQERSARSG